MMIKTTSTLPDANRWFWLRTADLAVSAPTDVFVKAGPFNTWRRASARHGEATHVVSITNRLVHRAYYGMG